MRLHPSTAFWTLLLTMMAEGFLPAVVDIMVIWVKFTHSSPFQFSDSLNVDTHSCHLLLDHFQFALIHGPDIPGSYAILLFTASTLLLSPVTSTTGYCFYFGSIPSVFLELFLHWSPVAYWAPPDLGSSSFSILSFCLFILFMGFSGQEYWSGLPFPSPVDHILSLEGLTLKLKFQYFGHLMWRTDSMKRPWCWERLRAAGEGDDRGWDGWMASLTQWTWVWVNSGSWWWTGRPGVLRFMGLQSWTWLSDWTELNFHI